MNVNSTFSRLGRNKIMFALKLEPLLLLPLYLSLLLYESRLRWPLYLLGHHAML